MWKGEYFILSKCVRYFSHSPIYRAVDKQSLSKLRKRTGISYVNCKKALEKFDNNIDQAESWLKEEAQKMGWAKATKLGGRKMASGLIGLKLDGNIGVMVELNCETDFVARNTKFQSLVADITNGCLQSAKTSPGVEMCWENESLKNLKMESGQTVSDLVALLIGNIGENMAVRRAVAIKSDEQFLLSSYVHAAGPDVKMTGGCLFGRYGALLRYKQLDNSQPREDIARQLCQHIVGMNPTCIGSPEDEPHENKEEEPKMIFQEFISDPSLSVGEVLQQYQISIDKYVRYECGETASES